MKILILGAKGMLGQALAKEFAKSSPVLWDREELDITKPDEVKEKIGQLAPETIINCAAYTDVDGAEKNLDLAYSLNGEAVESLAEVANDLGATLVQYSTAYAFDGEKKEGYGEEDEPDPQSVYGKSKLAGEMAARRANRYYIIRLDRLFGHAGGGKKSFVEKILAVAEGKEEIKLIDEELGGPTYAPDIAARTRHILENDLVYGIYHATNAGACTWYGFAQEIFKIRRIAVKLVPVAATEFPRPAPRPRFAILLNTKLPPMRSWQESLAEYLGTNT